MSHHAPEIVAHRAGPLRNGVAWHAEQTLPAFAETWARERVMCELDVRFTADGVPVVFHDATLQRITGRPGHLHEQDLRAYRALRADVLGADRLLARAEDPAPLATLRQVLAFARRSGARLDVELKNLPGDPAGFFRPEFLNRIDEIVRFRSLTEADIERIVHIQLRHLAGRLAARRLGLDVSEEAAAWLARTGYDPT